MILETLKKTFGFPSFRPYQENIIRNILEKQDILAILPTGGGKSLCYQLPSLLQDGTVIVISPLISLMKDQVEGLKQYGIAASYLNSSLDAEQRNYVISDLLNNKLKLLYIAPERFNTVNFVNILKKINISLFAIDEAHCISEWGHEFRPDYLMISSITNHFPDIPKAAFTATATLKVHTDIKDKLQLRNPFQVRASFNRPNLVYHVLPKEQIKEQLLNLLQQYEGKSGIIYRTTRRSVDELTDYLNSQGLSALSYHAGLTDEKRKNNQDLFNRDKVRIIVATIAFGMGINKSNIRFVFHADLPKSIEGYYQETGRAGRDNEPADCYLFYSFSDVPKLEYFINRMENPQHQNEAKKRLKEMVNYAVNLKCRRKNLLAYFDEQYKKDNCHTCDVCTGKINKNNITTDARILLSAIYRTGQRFGMNHIVDVVWGANTKKIKELNHDKIKTYGLGAAKNKKHWHNILKQIIRQKLVSQEGGQYPFLVITAEGYEVLYGKKPAVAIHLENQMNEDPIPQDSSTHQELFRVLQKLRSELARKQNVPPYIVFSDKSLLEMCRRLPQNHWQFKLINGVGEEKLKKYAESFLTSIKRFISDHPEFLDQSKYKSDSPKISSI